MEVWVQLARRDNQHIEVLFNIHIFYFNFVEGLAYKIDQNLVPTQVLNHDRDYNDTTETQINIQSVT